MRGRKMIRGYWIVISEPMDLEVHLTAHVAVQVVRQIEETAG